MASEKTEEATPKKLRDARKKGEVPKSRDLQNAFVLLAVAGALVGTGQSARRSLEDAIRLSIRSIEENVSGPRALEAVAALGMEAALPLLLAALVTGTAIGFLQVGGLLTFEPIQPKLERLDPIRGLKNLFSQKQLIELLKALLKIFIIGYVAYGVLEDAIRGVVGLPARDAAAAIDATGSVVSSLLFRVGGAALAIGTLDVLYQRWRHRQDQKMTKEEVKREYKDAEGDPHAKQSRERLHREIVEHDAVEQVRNADVLVVNPTHLAVALKYDADENDAPEVLARGQDGLAQRMIQAAREEGVPVFRDVPLAHALHELEVGEEIPDRLFEAVAAVLQAAWAEREEESR